MKISREFIHLYHIIHSFDTEMRSKLTDSCQYLKDSFRDIIILLLSQKIEDPKQVKNLIQPFKLTIVELNGLNQYLESQLYLYFGSNMDLAMKVTYFINQSDPTKDYFIEQIECGINQNKITYPDKFLYLNHLEFYKSIQEIAKTKHPHIQNIHLLGFYLYKKLNNINKFLSEQQVSSMSDSKLEKEIVNIEQIIKLFNVSTPEILTLSHAAHLMMYNDKKQFDLLYNSIQDRILELPSYDVNNILIILINTIQHNFQKWDKNYLDILQIYQTFYNLYPIAFFYNLLSNTIINLATLCIRTNQIDWFHQVFSTKVIRELSPENLKVYNFNLVKFSFYQGQYEFCIGELNQFKPDDIFQELELRRLQVMCFYELKERVLVDNYLNTFKVFIHRNSSLNPIFKESNNNFIRLLLRLNKTFDEKKIQSLDSEIETIGRIAEKNWLLSKLLEFRISNS